MFRYYFKLRNSKPCDKTRKRMDRSKYEHEACSTVVRRNAQVDRGSFQQTASLAWHAESPVLYPPPHSKKPKEGLMEHSWLTLKLVSHSTKPFKPKD
jgi:hypothetical protein